MLESSLNSSVLVLNRLWQAVNTCSARRAFSLLYQGYVRAVSSDRRKNFLTHDFQSWRDFSRENPKPRMVHTVSLKILIPSIVVLLLFDKFPRREVKLTRRSVFERDKNRCQYCGKIFRHANLSLDHVLPRDRGGRTTWENVVCCCISCNTRKGNRLPHEARMQLTRKPRCPKWIPSNNVSSPIEHPKNWQHFVNLTDWNVELSG
ncbi:MAG: HNH endonuclease [Candidatus Xiphinematobacter sp.]|nr:MAG: HNH endonuclease [Candidatus Xiphinematobacter sp.]